MSGIRRLPKDREFPPLSEEQRAELRALRESAPVQRPAREPRRPRLDTINGGRVPPKHSQ